MSDLLFISDNPKIYTVKDSLQSMLRLDIVVEPNLENALKDIFSSRPAVVFIQFQIGDTAAEEIAKQIRTVLKDNTPILNLLHGSEISTKANDVVFTHIFDMNMSQDKLEKSILRAVLTTALRHQMQDILIHRKHDTTPDATKGLTYPAQPESVSYPADDSIPASACGANAQIPDELLKGFEENYRSISSYRRLTYATLAVACLSAAAWYLFVGKQVNTGTNAKPAPSREAAPIAAPVPSAKPIKTPPTAKVQPAQVADTIPSAPPKPADSKALVLPTFISAKWRDPTYSQQKPGWERYVGPQYEFRILKSGNRIVAIQVLDINLKGISRKMLQSILQEISGSTTYQVTLKEEKEGFTIMRGSTETKANIVIYNKNSNIRAFVVSQEN